MVLGAALLNGQAFTENVHAALGSESSMRLHSWIEAAETQVRAPLVNTHVHEPAWVELTPENKVIILNTANAK